LQINVCKFSGLKDFTIKTIFIKFNINKKSKIMEKMVNKEMVNELLKNLGHQNISVVEKPIFYWNGNVVTDDETAPVKQVSSFRLSEKFGFSDFLTTHSDKKIVLLGTAEGKLVNENNEIRAFVS
jgi:hypothetical protein